MNSICWKILFVILLVALTLATADLLVATASILLLIMSGILFGVLVHGISAFGARRTPLSYRWSYALVVFSLLGLIAGGTYWMGSQVIYQVSQLVEQIQSSGSQLTQKLQQYPQLEQYVTQMQNGQMVSQASQVLSAANTGLQWLAWGLTALVVVFFIGVYLALEPDLYRSGVVKLVPPPQRARAEEVLNKLYAVLGYWILGRLLSMVIIGLVTGIVLWVLQVPLAITLGILAALLTFVPNVGPILAAIPQLLLATQVGSNTVLYVALLNILLQGVESYLITPLVQRQQVSLPPAVTISAQLLMGVLFGVMGVVMAAPLAASILLVTQMLYVRDRLGDESPGQLAQES